MTPAIVVLAYERPEALRRLLVSLDRATYSVELPVTLIVSLDHSDSAAGRITSGIARDFTWRFGPKCVIEQPEHLGVVRHFHVAGDLTAEYGDIILLEDDLTVSPAFFDYASKAIDGYSDDERIAGYCLYGVLFNGFTHEPFLPIEDGSDVFFMRVPYTQGLCFSARQWAAFRSWEGESHGLAHHPALHPAFLDFGVDEWFPALASYLAHTGRYFCFPRVSLTVGWGDAGAHFSEASSWFQTPMLMGSRRFSLTSLDDAIAVYDGFFELDPASLRALGQRLPDRDFDLDINASKRPENLRNDLVVTTRPVRKAIARFGLKMYPQSSTWRYRCPATTSPWLTRPTCAGRSGPKRRLGAGCTATTGIDIVVADHVPCASKRRA